MSRPRVHIVYEYGLDGRPHGSAYLRLLCPLTHPALAECMQVSYGPDYDGEVVDAVIIDRLWRPDVSLVLAQALVTKVRHARARLVYALDDNFLDLPLEGQKVFGETHLRIVRFFLTEADVVLVTTSALKERYTEFNENILVVPNALDERLIAPKRFPDALVSSVPQRMIRALRVAHRKPQVIGYMGTFTHDDDLLMILPALQEIWQRHPSEIEFQFIGVVGRNETQNLLRDLPVRTIHRNSEQTEYRAFMRWFLSSVRWDIAISPLRDSPFNRCKSDIKFLDYSALGVAGIYSRGVAYESTVRHLETGWLANNNPDAWVEALEQLLTDHVLRAKLAAQSRDYVLTQRILSRRALDWHAAILSILEMREQQRLAH